MGIGENERYVTQNHSKAEEPVRGNESRRSLKSRYRTGSRSLTRHLPPAHVAPTHTPYFHIATCSTESALVRLPSNITTETPKNTDCKWRRQERPLFIVLKPGASKAGQVNSVPWSLFYVHVPHWSLLLWIHIVICDRSSSSAILSPTLANIKRKGWSPSSPLFLFEIFAFLYTNNEKESEGNNDIESSTEAPAVL